MNERNRDAIYNAIYHGTITKLCHTEKIYTHTLKNAVILKGNMGITHMVSPVYNNLAVFFLFHLPPQHDTMIYCDMWCSN